MGDTIQIFTAAEIASLRRAGKILQECLVYTAGLAQEGITTGELDAKAEAFILEHGGKPAFKGYHGYTATLCTSVNEEYVHGIPGKRVLKDGDIVSIDCGVICDGLYTDACVTVGIGSIPAEAVHLLRVTEEALERAIAAVHGGCRVGDISATVQDYVEGEGLAILRPLTGHGLGRTLHQFPDIPNFGVKGKGAIIPTGTVIAIEPIVSISSANVKESSDGWTIMTADGSLAAHFEHTILVTDEGCEILA